MLDLVGFQISFVYILLVTHKDFVVHLARSAWVSKDHQGILVKKMRLGDLVLKIRNFARIPLISDMCLHGANSDLDLSSTDMARGTTLGINNAVGTWLLWCY
jgi:hypothetical protein